MSTCPVHRLGASIICLIGLICGGGGEGGVGVEHLGVGE
jgi:hypothetical protein